MAELPVAEDRHQKHDGHDQPRHHDRAQKLAAGPPALEHFQELKQKQEVPLRPGRGVGQRGVGGGAELGSHVPPVDLAAGKHRPHGRHKDHTEHHRHHGEHRHGVLEELIGPEHPVGPRDRLLGMEAVLAKQG